MLKRDINQLRDKTLVLRILDPRLESHLREKMAALEKPSSSSSQHNHSNHSHNNNNSHNTSTAQHSSSSHLHSSSQKSEAKIFDLEGVTCEPAIQSSSLPLHYQQYNRSIDDNDNDNNNNDPSIPTEQEELLDQYTLWNFHCDGATYPARLINLPCPIEIHKTHDHAMYYKCVDVAQMLIVYEDMTSLEEAESSPGYKSDAHPSYYRSGLTPPMDKVVQRRFMNREHSAVPPQMQEVMEVEKDLVALMDAISTKDPTKRAGRGNHGTNRSMHTKVLEEVEDTFVGYEPWMDDYGKEPKGVEFDEMDVKCKTHPELWLDEEELKKIRGSVVSLSSKLGEMAGTGVSASTSTKVKKKKKSAANKEDLSGSGAGASATEKKPKKKKKKKKEETMAMADPLPPPVVNRPASIAPMLLDSIDISLDNGGGIDGFDFNLDDLDDGDFDLDATNI
jgi:hypothetical protein